MADITFAKQIKITSDLTFAPGGISIDEDFYPISEVACTQNDTWTDSNFRTTLYGNVSYGNGIAVDQLEVSVNTRLPGALHDSIWGKITFSYLDAHYTPADAGKSVKIASFYIGDYEIYAVLILNRYVTQAGGTADYWDCSFQVNISNHQTGGSLYYKNLVNWQNFGVAKSNNIPYYVGAKIVKNNSGHGSPYYVFFIFDEYDKYQQPYPDISSQDYVYAYQYYVSLTYLSLIRPIQPDWAYSSNVHTTIFNMDKFCTTMGIDAPVEDVSEEAGLPSDVGGMGQGDDEPTFDDSSDTIDLPVDPTIGVSNVGFVNVYKTYANSLQQMGVELFPALQYTAPTQISGTDVTDAVVNGFNSIVTFLANIPSFFEQTVAATLVNYVIDCHVIPVTPAGGTDEAIKVGYKTLTVHGDRMSNDYVTFDCGTINLGEYYTNFADFLTSAKLFLPFVGFVPCRPEWFYRDSLNVTYKFNIIDGSFMTYVRSTGRYVNNNNAGPTIVAQYSGNACVHLPITGVTYSNMVSGLIGAGAGAVASAGSGNVAGVAMSAMNASSLYGDMPSSNSYTASGSFLSGRRPFLMIERPVSNFSKTYAKERGIPSNISVKLSNARGFAIVSDIHLDGITATDQEKSELETLLSKGVIF